MMRRDHPTKYGRAAILAMSAALLGCGGEGSSGSANDANVAGDPILNLPAIPSPQPPVDRATLLAAVAEAASATARGAPEAAAPQLDGRQFELRIRFGCRGPVREGEQRWLGWSFDPEERRLRVEARPTIAGEDPIIQSLGLAAFEAVEGFWIPRPWLLQPACPVVPAATPAPADAQAAEEGEPAAAPSDAPVQPSVRPAQVGIAQFFTDADPRTGRRDGRPYQFVRALEEGKSLASTGYTLVLAGRLRALPGRGVILCTPGGPETPPDCVVSAEFDRVWIERPDNREIIAEWRTG